MATELKTQTLEWLRNGGQRQAYAALLRCDVESVYIDSGVPLNDAGEMIDIYDIKISAPRDVFDSTVAGANNDGREIENSLRICAEAMRMAVQNVYWAAQLSDLSAKMVQGAISQFQDGARIGSGGFGEVWQTTRLDDGSDCARKVLIDSSDVAARRFVREARILESLTHPRIVRVIDKQLDWPPYFYVMPRYGRSLYKELESIRGDSRRIKSVFGCVLDAVSYAHERGVIHRDLKPENVLMNDDVDVVVSDFGLGLELDRKTTRLTQSGTRIGTALYQSPEQALGSKNVDARTDIFSLGRMLYELYAGELTTAVQDIDEVPSLIGPIVRKATRPKPEERYQSTEDMRRDLMNALDAMLRPADKSALMMVGELAAMPSAPDVRVDEFAAMLSSAQGDSEVLVDVVNGITGTLFMRLEGRHPEIAKATIVAYAAALDAKGWPFSATDELADTCSRLFDASTVAESRAHLLVAILLLGVSHTRYYVMEKFGALLEKARGMNEVLVFEMQLLPHRAQCAAASPYVSNKAGLSPRLLAMITPKSSSD